MVKELFYCLVISHAIFKRKSSWYSDFINKMSSLPLTHSSKRLSFHSSPSGSNIANMSFGTGRVYFKSQHCLVLAAGIILIFLLSVMYGMFNDRLGFSIPFRSPAVEYGIMIDAGSTGSRVHVYKFYKSGLPAPVLQNEVFEQVRPGLSSYAENPDDGAKSINSLLDIAKDSIPENLWSSTPLALKATAGLRLLKDEQSKALLDKVRELFKNSPFRIAEDPVSIIEGTDEGIFAWLTVNYLLDLIGKDTVGTIDLGGGSMQITFSPVERKTIDSSPKGFIQKTAVFNNNMEVYVHSYLGLGLMSARELVFGGPSDSPSTVDVKSVCMPSSYKGTWENARSKYNIQGDKSGSGKFDACHEVVRKAIAGKINRPDELKRESFYAFSYFFDRAAQTGLIHPEDGGVISVGEYEKTARKVCESDKVDVESEFMCLDLTIIFTFLEDGYGFSPDIKLEVRKKIKGKENSWALGATFFLMNQS